METPAPLLSSRRPELAMLDAVIAKALEKSPAARFENGAAFAAALEDLRGAPALLRLAAPDAAHRRPATPGLGEPPSSASSPCSSSRAKADTFFLKAAEAAATLAITDRPLEVIKVTSGIRALTTCLAQPPDLVLLDYDMPGANGIDTLSELRAIPGAAQATVLVVSASVGAVERWRFSVLGVRDFLAKPVELPDLVDAIKRLASFASCSIQDTNVAPPSAREGSSGVFEERLPSRCSRCSSQWVGRRRQARRRRARRRARGRRRRGPRLRAARVAP